MIAFIGLLSLVGLPISVIGIVVQTVRKKPSKKFKIAAPVCLILFVVCIILSPSGDNDAGESGDAQISSDAVDWSDLQDDVDEQNADEENDTSNAAEEENDISAAVEDNTSDAGSGETEDSHSILIEMLESIDYMVDEAEAIAEILINVGILDADDMWIILDNDPLKACALEYNGHQVNFTTEDNILFYVQITGWDEEISHYGWYTSNWSGKLKYGYYTETETYSVDLYSVDSDGSGGYYAVYDAESDSVSPYGDE